MKKPVCLLLLALGALAPLSASAKPYHYTPVRWIVETRNNLSEDDKYVTIVGHVTRRISDEEYWFADGTGSIRLDSENFDLPIGQRIVIGGRIDQAYLGFGHVEVDVRKWHYPEHPVAAKPKPTAPPASAAVPTPTAPPPAPVTPPPAPAADTSKPSLAPAPEPAPAPAAAATPPPAPATPPPAPATPAATSTNAAPASH